jgi:hypothetical protein
MNTIKLTERDNFYNVLPLVDPPDKENQVKMYKKYRFRSITAGSVSKSDPDPYQNDRPDQNRYQKGLDQQHYKLKHFIKNCSKSQ